MRHTRPLLIAALAAPVLLAFSMPRDTIAFHPSEGTTITKTFTHKAEMTLDDMEILMNGQENPMMPEMETESTEVSIVVVTDKYVATEDGVPMTLLRTFDEISHDSKSLVAMEMLGESQDFDLEGEGTSALEGKTVAFKMEEGDYEKSFVEDEGDEQLLEELTEDMDLRVFLPDGDVSKGDSWDVDAGRLRDFLFPGGDLSIDIESIGDEPPSPGMDPSHSPSANKIWGEIEGDATATYTGTRDVDGTSVAVIEIEIDIETANDLSEFFSEMMGDILSEGMEMDVSSVDMEVSMTGKGELLWNVRAGHIYSFDMSGEIALTSDSAMEMDMGGQTISIEESTSMSGTYVTTVTVE